MRQKTFVQSRDDISNYRQQCEVRLKRLERYKKTKSFCSLDEASTSELETCQQHRIEQTRSDSESPTNDKFSLPQNRTPYDLLREKMLSMIETDMTLYNSLLTLGDKIQELRQKQPQRSTSETSLSSSENDCEEEKDELRPMAERQNKFSVSMSAITNLYVDNESDQSEDDETENSLLSFQYFSRKNSILRIPIPARSSNRFLGTKIPRRPSELLRPRPYKTAQLPDSKPSLPTTDNQQLVEERFQQKLNVNEMSEINQISPPSSSQHSPNNNSTLSSCSSSNERKATLSAASIDSGIRDDDSSSPINNSEVEDDQKTILEI